MTISSRRAPYLLLLLALAGCAGKPPKLTPDTRYGGCLEMAGKVPVVHFYGTPEEIGKQHAALLGPQIRWIYENYVPAVIEAARMMEPVYEFGKPMLAKMPEARRVELKALAAAAGVEYETAAIVQMFPDLLKAVSPACTSFAAGPAATANRHVLYARNLDFPSFGILEQVTCVQVYHPKGGRAFAVIGYPGLIGVINGVNDRGLAVAAHQVFWTGLDREAEPYLIMLRRVLEECGTVEEGVRLLKAARHPVHNNYMLVDRAGNLAVVEGGPEKHLLVRKPKRDQLFCTNYHFNRLARNAEAGPRWNRLSRAARKEHGRHSITSLRKLLHRCRLPMTVQSMVFDLTANRLYLSCGSVPSSAGTYQIIDLAALFGKVPEPPRHEKK